MSETLPLAAWRPRQAARVAETAVERARIPVIDAHNHLGRWLSDWDDRPGEWMVRDVGELLALMDHCNVTAVVNLDGRWGDELEDNLTRYDRAHPGRFATFCHVDWADIDHPSRLVESLRDSAARGARGLKVWKDLGLWVKDPGGALVLPDDPRLGPLFHEAGLLGLPVLIHTADPLAFFDPVDEHNERLDELGAHPEWSFHGAPYPSFGRLLESLEALVAAHPGTTFIGAHVCCYAENLAWVGDMLSRYPNLACDISARIGELGRTPRATARLINAHPDRVLFGTDCFPLTAEALRLYFRFVETDDECFAYAPWSEVPPQGRWAVSALDLDDSVLEPFYRGNAERLILFH